MRAQKKSILRQAPSHLHRVRPVALGSGYGSELRGPLGVTIVGGLIVSQMLTLYTTPIVYLYLDRVRLWGLELIKRRPHPGSAPTAIET